MVLWCPILTLTTNRQGVGMHSAGRNFDLYDNSPQKMLERAIAQLETAKVDPHFFGTVKSDRIAWYQREVDRWREVVG